MKFYLTGSAIYPQHRNTFSLFNRFNLCIFGYGYSGITFCRGAKKGIRKGHGVTSLKAGGFAANIAANTGDILNGKRVHAAHDFTGSRLPIASNKIIVDLNQINRIHAEGDCSHTRTDKQAVNGFKTVSPLFVKKGYQGAGIKDVYQ